MKFNNKHVVITGGAKGIGGACSATFSQEGASVSILDISSDGGEMAKKIGDKAMFIQCDVSNGNDVELAVSNAIDRFGNIDILINNAGIQEYGTVLETSEEVWDRVMNVNLKSAFLCTKSALPSMIKQHTGVVVNVSSVQAFISQEKVAAYTTSKTAMLGLTRSIAVDYGPKIRSVAICPGTIDTPMLRYSIAQSPDPQEVLEECSEMHLVKRIGTANEVAQFILFLCGDNAGFCTGQAYRIDGGLGISIGGSKRD